MHVFNEMFINRGTYSFIFMLQVYYICTSMMTADALHTHFIPIVPINCQTRSGLTSLLGKITENVAIYETSALGLHKTGVCPFLSNDKNTTLNLPEDFHRLA